MESTFERVFVGTEAERLAFTPGAPGVFFFETNAGTEPSNKLFIWSGSEWIELQNAT